MVKWQLSVSNSVHGIVTDKSWKMVWFCFCCGLLAKKPRLDYWQKTFYSPQHLNISVDELNRQVRLLDEAVDCADVESNIAQGYRSVHRELEMEGEFQKRISCCT